MLGRKADKPPFNPKLGYDKIALTLSSRSSENEYIRIEREIGKTKYHVNSNIEDIETKTYSQSGKNAISNFYISLLGISDEPKVFTNFQMTNKSRITIRSISHFFYLNEKSIAKSESVLLDINNSLTKNLYTLIYFLDGEDYTKNIDKEDTKIKKAKKKAVVAYINKKLNQYSEKIENLKKYLSDITFTNLNDEINSRLNEITVIENHISDARKQSQSLLEATYEYSITLEEARFLYQRYEILSSEYNADLERLSQIVEAENLMSKQAPIENCPFCNHEISNTETPGIEKAALAEFQAIQNKNEGLKNTMLDLSNEISQLEESLKEINIQHSNVTALIDTDLQPRLSSLIDLVHEMKSYQEIANEIRTLSVISKQLNLDAIDEENDIEDKTEKDPRNLVKQEYLEFIDNTVQDMLEKTHYKNYSSSRLSRDKFDLVVNGDNKEHQGQGFSAFLNSVHLFAWYKLLSEKGKFSLPILMLDSPILSLVEKSDLSKDEEATPEMKNGLFQYLVNNQDVGQVIVVENKLPDNVTYENTNILFFSGDKNEGRAGLLYL